LRQLAAADCQLASVARYQLPSLLREGCSIVVSAVIARMDVVATYQ